MKAQQQVLEAEQQRIQEQKEARQRLVEKMTEKITPAQTFVIQTEEGTIVKKKKKKLGFAERAAKKIQEEEDKKREIAA